MIEITASLFLSFLSISLFITLPFSLLFCALSPYHHFIISLFSTFISLTNLNYHISSRTLVLGLSFGLLSDAGRVVLNPLLRVLKTFSLPSSTFFFLSPPPHLLVFFLFLLLLFISLRFLFHSFLVSSSAVFLCFFSSYFSSLFSFSKA